MSFQLRAHCVRFKNQTPRVHSLNGGLGNVGVLEWRK